MIKKTLSKFLNRLGYEKKVTDKAVQQKGLYQLYAYTRKDGSFDYDAYKRIQIQGNKRKLDVTWALEENIAFLSDHIKSALGPVDFGLCHGTRGGKEQAWFKKYAGGEVIGTEISDTAEQFENTIQWDFHEVKPEWLGKADFIYSNAFDHSYDPEKCLNAWMSCLKPGGLCILEHTSSSDRARELDPFGAPISVMPYLILTWGRGRYWAKEILETPARKQQVNYSVFIVIQKG